MSRHSRTLLASGLALLALSGLLYGTLRLMYGGRAAYVNVRWAPAVDEATRARLEQEFGLDAGEFREQRTWLYLLTDVSGANIERIVKAPAVEDTASIDRGAFRIDPAAERAGYARDTSGWIAGLLEFLVRASLLSAVGAFGFRAFRGAAAMLGPGWALPGAASRIDIGFAIVLAAALILRLSFAASAPYIHDEDNTSIPLSRSISFSPGHLNLPLRGENHGALPAYVVKASSSLFGTAPLAYRAIHVLIAMGTIVLVYLVASQWYGVVAARWAGAFMAFNEYHLANASRATAHGPYLFLVAAAVFAFSRFLASQRTLFLYAAGLLAGLAFYCKEHAVLLLPVFGLMLLRAPYRRWLRSPHAYLACLVFVLVVAPDVLWNLRTDPDTARVTYSGADLGQATYSAHLRRIGGIGFSPYPMVFYARDLVMPLYQLVTGQELIRVTSEYPSLNPALGLLLLGAVLMTTVRPAEHSAGRAFLLLMAWFIFILFTLIEPGDPPYRLAPVNWVWVEATLIPACIIAGAHVAGVSSRWRNGVWLVAIVALLLAVDTVVWRTL